MKWSLFNWKKPVVSSGEPGDYQVVKNTVSQNERNITNINSQITNVNNQLTNTVSTNTAQTISGAKTFSNQVVINNTPEPLTIKATNTNKSYILFKTPQNTSTLSIGSNATGANIDVNSGDFTIETQQANKTITLNTGRVKLNRSALDLGTTINAGYGGTEVKFIPDDNSTKTLKFYENNQSDRRKFNLLVPEPTNAQNPTTKNYVDTKNTEARNYTDQQISNLNITANVNYQDISISNFGIPETWGILNVYSFEASYNNTRFLEAVPIYEAPQIGRMWDFRYCLSSFSNRIYFSFAIQTSVSTSTPPANTKIRIFYLGESRAATPFTLISQEANNEN